MHTPRVFLKEKFLNMKKKPKETVEGNTNKLSCNKINNWDSSKDIMKKYADTSHR